MRQTNSLKKQAGAAMIESALLITFIALVSVSGVSRVGVGTLSKLKLANTIFATKSGCANQSPIGPGGPVQGGSRGTCGPAKS